jgi:hypothetical protein
MHVITNLIKQLPGTSTLINVSSLLPEKIIEKIIKFKPSTDFIILQNNDVWRYRNNPVLLDFLNNFDATFIVITIGIDYINVSDNVLEVSLPDGLDVSKNKTTFRHHHKKYGYSSINNRPSWPRLFLGYQLWQVDKLKDIIYSQNLQHNSDTLLHGYEKVLFESLPDHDNFLNLLPITWNEETKNFANDHSIFHDAFVEAYANIAVETETEFFGHDQRYPTPTITEKSFKSFLSGQVAIPIAAPGVIAFLKSHGFFMFDSLVSSEYDQLLTEEKINLVVELILRGDEYIADYYFQNKQALEQNFIQLTEHKYQQSILNTAIAFINKHLK